MTKKNLIAAIVIMACGVLLLLPLFLPFLTYNLSSEFILNKPKMKYSATVGLLDGDLVTLLGNHFRNFTSRKWLLLVSDANVIMSLVTIVAGLGLAVLEALQFAKIKLDKIKKWYGLGVLICGCIVLTLSLLFFIFSSNVTKDATATTEGYTISAFKGHVGWYLIVLCSTIAGLIAFKRKIKKVEE